MGNTFCCSTCDEMKEITVDGIRADPPLFSKGLSVFDSLQQERAAFSRRCEDALVGEESPECRLAQVTYEARDAPVYHAEMETEENSLYRPVRGATEPWNEAASTLEFEADAVTTKTSEKEVLSIGSARKNLAENFQAVSMHKDKASDPSSLAMGVLFILPDSSLKEVTFTRRPLGLDFKYSTPIKILHVLWGSSAYDLGVQEGWEIHSINGKVFVDKTFEETYAALTEISLQLPFAQ
mmetsp:Transcript_103194/g.291394  ORF Transcript_103194/g.291394 Transcript_103194/m.291394 type:complete len:238 (+) Transcript_103194:53-766(+)